jgi:hypothetical protein
MLGLVVNALVLWNTIYMQAALNHLQAGGVPVREENIIRLSPHRYSSFNFLGHYSFRLPPAVARDNLRPLRDPDVVDILVMMSCLRWQNSTWSFHRWRLRRTR